MNTPPVSNGPPSSAKTVTRMASMPMSTRMNTMSTRLTRTPRATPIATLTVITISTAMAATITITRRSRVRGAPSLSLSY